MRQDVFLAAALGLVLASVPAWADDPAAEPTYKEVKQIISNRCQVCHSKSPQWMDMDEAPLGVMMDTPEEIHALAPRIEKMAIKDNIMPPGNATQITDKERSIIGAWITAGAKIP